MTNHPDQTPKRNSPPDPRAERLKAALKANIAKRKQQARSRDTGARDTADRKTPDTRPEQD